MDYSGVKCGTTFCKISSYYISFSSGLADQNTLVQNAALFALGQYSEYLQVICSFKSHSKFITYFKLIFYEFQHFVCIQLISPQVHEIIVLIIIISYIIIFCYCCY